MWRLTCSSLTLLVVLAPPATAELVRLEIDRREPVLAGRAFGAAGSYEVLSGTAHFALDPALGQNQIIVDLALAPRNASGRVEFSADFYLLKPADPRRGNGRLFFEVGNRGGKRILPVFQQAEGSADPRTAEEFGDGALMAAGYTLLWLGWQWDVPEGRMRMEMPIATDGGTPITGLVRGNIIVGQPTDTASVADRGHRAYLPVDPDSPDHTMTRKAKPFDEPEPIARDTWRFLDNGMVQLDGGFEPGVIYDVVYLSSNPRVVGVGLAGVRDIVSFFKYRDAEANPMPGLSHALGWGVSQTGRFLRHFVYQGFNEDEQGRQVFDGVFDQVGGAGRGSFNHRFGQASRDALQHFNIQFPVDMFPFTDAEQEDPETGEVDGLLARAQVTSTVPKFFHLMTNSEYFNRGGSLTHTDPAGTRDAPIPETSRIYFVSGAPHIVGSFPPGPNTSREFPGQSSMNPLRYDSVVRALFHALSAWVVDDTPPPPSRYPRIDDGTLVRPEAAGWPAIPGPPLPTEPQTPHRLDFGPHWKDGIVSNEPPVVGSPFAVLVPAVDADGNDRAGIRLPMIAVPLATHAGWNYRDPSIGASDRLSSEIGSYVPFARTAEARAADDSRPAIAERYRDRNDYVGRVAMASLELVEAGYLLAGDVPWILERAAEHYDWATGR